jgi:hypothetical protein
MFVEEMHGQRTKLAGNSNLSVNLPNIFWKSEVSFAGQKV